MQPDRIILPAYDRRVRVLLAESEKCIEGYLHLFRWRGIDVHVLAEDVFCIATFFGDVGGNAEVVYEKIAIEEDRSITYNLQLAIAWLSQDAHLAPYIAESLPPEEAKACFEEDDEPWKWQS